jgi:energy-converting hydrogenase Eha subunit A
MDTISSLHPQPDSSVNTHSTFKTVGAVLAALATWIFVATVLNLPLRTSWPHYHEAETAFSFTLAMKLARLALGVASSLAAGFVAAWIGKDRMRSATLTGVVLLGLFIPNHYLLWSKFPVWYHLIFLVSLVPFTLLGAALHPASKSHDGSLTGDLRSTSE